MKILLMYGPSRAHLAALQEAAPQATFAVAGSEGEAREQVVDARAILGNRYFLQSLPYSQRLRWMQSNSVGMDLILDGGGERLREITLSNARGVYDDEVADHALALILGLVRGLHLARDAQRDRRWDRWSLGTLAGRRALVLGWGGVGQAIGRRLLTFGVEVEGVRRTHHGPPARQDDPRMESRAAGRRRPVPADAPGTWALSREGTGAARSLGPAGCLVHGPASWRQALPSTDILVLALPLTAQTRSLVGAKEIDALPASAVVVNVGRGGTLDDGALLAALRENRLLGAGLDVMADEPLSPDHPAWGERRLWFTPHVARSLERPPYRWEPLFVENVRRYGAGELLLNVVDQEAGY